MVLPFSIFKTRGDGSLVLLERADHLESARESVSELAKFWPGSYVILNEATGERVSITAGGDTKNQVSDLKRYDFPGTLSPCQRVDLPYDASCAELRIDCTSTKLAPILQPANCPSH